MLGCLGSPTGHSTGEHVDQAVERAVKEVRAIRDKIGLLVELALRAGKREHRAEADKILDMFFDEEIDYSEALEKLRRPAQS